MGFAEYEGPVRVERIAEGVTQVSEAPDNAARFVPAGHIGESPEFFRATAMNTYAGAAGLLLRVERIVPDTHGARSVVITEMLRVVLERNGWADVSLRQADELTCSMSLGHELIRHGYMMINRESFPAPRSGPGGVRIGGWERYPGRAVWFTFVHACDES